MPVDFDNVPSRRPWRETFRFRGLARLPGLAPNPSEAFFGFEGNTIVSISAAGTTTNGVETGLEGGNLFIQAGSGAATGVLSYQPIIANNTVVHLSNPKTKNWYCAVWGKYVGTKVNNQTRAVWCINVGGTYYGLGVQPNTATVYEFIAGATTIQSTVAIDAAANVMRLWEFWHDVSQAKIFIAIDDEAPVSAADTNLPTSSGTFMNRADTGTDNNTQRLTTSKAYFITERS
jgi:hypothetical protein